MQSSPLWKQAEQGGNRTYAHPNAVTRPAAGRAAPRSTCDSPTAGTSTCYLGASSMARASRLSR
eukprot:5666906-Prymnesium_polylepis.1